jgi:2-polyprenyl-3-methyl-5-hydroxy-6-metoxy-1,4-benzoquinol methylase
MAAREWQRFFKVEAPRYLGNSFTKNTVAEVDFILRELDVKPGQCILDVGCGTGRHSLELARRGYGCTGIDQSIDMLEIAGSTARNMGLAVEFIQGDAAATILDRRFDHAICICEGAFSLLEVGTDPVDYHVGILTNIHAMVKPGGMFLLTALNALRLVREHDDADVSSGHFDFMTTAHVERMPIEAGNTVSVVEKGFMPSELKALLESTGFQVQAIWGGTAGDWNKGPIKLDEIEIMALSRRSA